MKKRIFCGFLWQREWVSAAHITGAKNKELLGDFLLECPLSVFCLNASTSLQRYVRLVLLFCYQRLMRCPFQWGQRSIEYNDWKNQGGKIAVFETWRVYVELEKGVERANGVGEITMWSSWLPHPHSNIDQGREVQWDPLLTKRTLSCKWQKPNPKWLVESTSKKVCRWIGQKKWTSAVLLSSLSSVRALLISGLGICTSMPQTPKLNCTMVLVVTWIYWLRTPRFLFFICLNQWN